MTVWWSRWGKLIVLFHNPFKRLLTACCRRSSDPVDSTFLSCVAQDSHGWTDKRPPHLQISGQYRMLEPEVLRDHQVYPFPFDQMRKLRPTEGSYLPKVTQMRGHRQQSPSLPWISSLGRFPLRSHRHLSHCLLKPGKPAQAPFFF